MPADFSSSKKSPGPSAGKETPPGNAPNAPDENIPLQGTHQGETDAPLTSSVRAQEPPDPTPGAEERVGEENAEQGGAEEADDIRTYQLAHDPASGRHRVRVRPPGADADAPGGGFKELSRHSSPEEMSDALESGLPDGPRFVVLENTDTGETVFDREGALSADWFAGGRFDQATVFDSEDEAAKYADQ